jgi:hypothetical protein
MTALLFEILILLAFLHFVYERIIAPSARLRLRYRLFAIRDGLRWLRIDAECSEEEFRLLDAAMNNVIRMLHRFDISSVLRSAQIIEADPTLRNRIEKRMAIIEETRNADYQRLNTELLAIAKKAMLVNNGACFFYLVPIVMVIAGIEKLSRFIKKLVSVPEGELGKVIEFTGGGHLAHS